METVTDIACPACACVCDDLRLTIDGNRLVHVTPACPLAERWFFEQSSRTRPTAELAGREVGLDDALQAATAILSAARYPLIYGLSRSSTPGQRAAVALAEQIGGVVDTTASLCHAPSILAVQTIGESTCSLGEVRNRSDLVIYWGCNPAETHPRHAERYAVFPPGLFVPRGRSDRTIVMVGDAREVHDWRLDPDGAKPDVVIPLEPDGDFEAITSLRLLLRDAGFEESLRSDAVSSSDSLERAAARPNPSGAQRSDLVRLISLMKGCRSGVVFFGLGLTGMSFDGSRPSSTTGHANVELLLRLVTELNAVTRFYARRMRIQGDVSGADSVLCWQTGFPFSVDLARGYPRYGPGEYSAESLLSRSEPDACVLVGAETVGAFSSAARNHLRRIPTIVIDYPAAETDFVPTVRFTTAPYGLAARGTIYRMDEIPLPLQAPLRSELPTDEDILRTLLARCGNRAPSRQTPVSE